MLHALESLVSSAVGVVDSGMRRSVRLPLPMGQTRALFELTDDGAGGRLQTKRRWIKFLLRTCWNAGAMKMNCAVFLHDALAAIPEHEPAVLIRPLRSYLRRGLAACGRASATQSHFAWLSRCIPKLTIDRLYAGEAFELLGDGSPVAEMGLELTRASGLGREGELALHLTWEGERVMSMAFSVIDASLVVSNGSAPPLHGLRAVVGVIQGARGADIRLRDLTSAAQRLRPSAVLVVAMQGLTSAWGLQAPLGVSARSHIYAGYASHRRAVGLDYDAAWRDAGADSVNTDYWLLPAFPALRPEAEVKSSHRAQHRRRNDFRATLFDAVRHSAQTLFQAGSQQ